MGYIPLKELHVYQLSRQLSAIAWEVYIKLSFEQKKLMGDQFLSAFDSVGANISEGYGRYHALDQVKFYITSRGSLNEALYHWAELMYERDIITKEVYHKIEELSKKLEIKLNNFIKTTRNQKLK